MASFLDLNLIKQKNQWQEWMDYPIDYCHKPSKKTWGATRAVATGAVATGAIAAVLTASTGSSDFATVIPINNINE